MQEITRLRCKLQDLAKELCQIRQVVQPLGMILTDIDHFKLILPKASLKDTIELTERLRQGIKNLEIVYLDWYLGNITISLGVAGFPEHGRNSTELIQCADRALYDAKALGRDRIRVYS